MTNDCLAVLRTCCSPTVLQTLELLVSTVGLLFTQLTPHNNMFMINMCIYTHCTHEISYHIRFQVQSVSGEGELTLSSRSLAALTDDIYEKTEQLFSSCNVSLKRDGDMVRTVVNSQTGNLPLVLCIAVRSLALLCLS